MTTNPSTFSKRAMDALLARNDAEQWERLIGNLLQRLELPEPTYEAAKADYLELANSIARKLNIPRTDIDIFVQGSVRTKTTIPQRHPAKFDLDVVVKLTNPRLALMDPHELFKEFGKALEGHESVTGVPEPKRRCWFLSYPGKAYSFDVTPAVREPLAHADSVLRVRDPDTHWSPSNPVAFADWFCTIANRRFRFQQVAVHKAFDARANVEPMPDMQIGMDDILRRVVQLLKLHRDGMYWFETDDAKRAQPISVILVTLAAHAYEKLWAEDHLRQRTYSSAIQVALDVVEELPKFIRHTNGRVEVLNPELMHENFADKWNTDQGARAKQFKLWHKRLEDDVDALLHQDEAYIDADKLRAVFGNAGVEAWKASKPKDSIAGGLLNSAMSGTPKPSALGGLINSAMTNSKASNLTSPTQVGSRGTLG